MPGRPRLPALRRAGFSMRYYLGNHYVGRVVAAALGDWLCWILAATGCWFLLAPPVAPEPFAVWVGTAGVLNFVILYYADAYGLTVLGSGRRSIFAIFAGLGVGAALILGVQATLGLPRLVVEVGSFMVALYVPFILIGRLLFRIGSARPRFSHRVLLVGNSDLSRAIARSVRERRNLGTEISGFLSDDIEDQGGWIEGFPVLGMVHEIEKLLEQDAVGRIVVASKSREEHFPSEVLLAVKLKGMKVDSGVAFYERVTGRIYLRDLRPSYLIFNDGFAMGWTSELLKRLLDAAAATVGLLLCAPILGAAMLAIKLDSRGPVFFGQERVGRGGDPFHVWKLRSMHDRAEEFTGPVWCDPNDSRMTRVGRYLRRARVDELPQLWNVLRGDMSLVGPRPERPEFVETLSTRYPYFRARSALRPGITGWAQIRHGYVNDVGGVEDKLALDLYYMKYRSLFMDLVILWKTLKTVVLMRGT